MKLDCGWFDLCSYSILNNKDKESWFTCCSMNFGIVGALEALCKFEEPLSSNRRAMAALAAARRRVAAQRRRQASWASEHRNDRGTSKCCMWAWRPEKFSSEPKVLIYRSISIRATHNWMCVFSLFRIDIQILKQKFIIFSPLCYETF